MRLARWGAMVVMTAGCAKPAGDAQRVPPKPSATASATATASAATTAAASASASAEAPVGVRTSDFPIAVGVFGAGHLAVVDMAKHEEELSPRVTIEKRSPDGTWRPLPGEESMFRWTADCAPAKAPAACARVEGGSTFTPAPWSGRSCGGQCPAPCEETVSFLPGDFRWVVRACGHEDREVRSPVVSLPARSGRALERWGFAQGIVSAEAVRLDVAQPRFGAGVLGYPRRSGTEKALSREAVAELAAVLAAEQGYDDAVERRCASRDLVGLVLSYEPPATTYGDMGGAKPIQGASAHVVLDFGCKRMLAQWVGIRTMWRDTDLRGSRPPESTYFDGLAPRLLALARAALPGDKDLAAPR